MTPVVDAYRLLIADAYEVAGLSRRTSERLAARSGQTAARWHVLSVLSEEALSVAGAARRLGLARQSVQRVVNDLREDGLVTVSPDPSDRRAPRAALTEEGQRVLARLQHASEGDRTRLLEAAGVDEAALARARATLQAVAAALREAG